MRAWTTTACGTSLGSLTLGSIAGPPWIGDPIGTVPLASAGTTATWSWQAPNDPAVVGITFRLQGGALLAGGSNALGAATSNGLEAVIGVR